MFYVLVQYTMVVHIDYLCVQYCGHIVAKRDESIHRVTQYLSLVRIASVAPPRTQVGGGGGGPNSDEGTETLVLYVYCIIITLRCGMRSNRVVRASQCQSRNSSGLDPRNL